MTRRFVVAVLLITCVLLSVGSLASAADDILKLVPAEASGLVVINRPTALDAKLQALGRAMQLPAPSPLAILKQRFGVAGGWDENGTIALLLLPSAEEREMPTPVLLVSVTDYDRFLQPFTPENEAGGIAEIKVLNQTHCVRRVGGYAAIVEQPRRETLKKLQAVAEIPAALAPWQKWLSEKDVGGLVLQPGIKRLSSRVQQGMEQMKAQMANGPEQAKAMVGAFDMYSKLLRAAENEVATVGFGLQLDEKSGLRLTKRALLIPDGRWAQLLAQPKPAKENPLAVLPSEPFVVAAGLPLSGAMGDAMMNASANMMKSMPSVYGMSQEQIDKMAELSVQGMKGVRAISMSMGVGRGGEPMYAPVVSVMQVDNSRAFMAHYESWMKEYGELLGGVNNPMLPAPEVGKSEVNGISVLQITVKAPQPPADQQTPQQAKMMKTMFGPEGKLVGWIAPANEHSVVLAYDKDRLLGTIEAIKQGKPGLASDAEVSKTAALLPSDALVVGYLSPSGAIEFAKRIVPALVPSGASPNLPEFPQTPPIGLAVTTGPNEAQACMVVPAEVLKAVGAYVGKVQAMRSGPPAMKP